jgi:effector-binding domain-containing protein
VLSRELDQKKFMKDMPDVPKGDYVVIIFRSSFDGMPKAMETISTYLEKDGSWRVNGYSIKNLQQK